MELLSWFHTEYVWDGNDTARWVINENVPGDNEERFGRECAACGTRWDWPESPNPDWISPELLFALHSSPPCPFVPVKDLGISTPMY